MEPLFVIAIDRTEWQLGKSWVNVLMLSVGYKNISISLCWLVLEEKGCSENAERCLVLQQFIDECGAESISFVTADRQFASKEWLKFLVGRQISFRLRIKAYTIISDKCGKPMRASKLCWTRENGRTS
jgi:hypothetical protein